VKHIFSTLMASLLWVAQPVWADHRDLILIVAPELDKSGLMRFLLPRFSLKTGVGIHVQLLADDATPPIGALRLHSGPGTPVLARNDRVFTLSQPDPDNKAAMQFHDWVRSDIGQRTISQFTPDDGVPFSGAANIQSEMQETVVSGDAKRGEVLAFANCGRCHVIGARNRMKGIGSTPSFALMRGFDDWEERFRGFYALNPHPSFTQIIGVTAPFDKSRPPPISPLRLTPREHDDIVAFTGTIEPVDLGAPLVHQ